MTQYFQSSDNLERESLLDLITVRSPYATPMIRQLPHVTMKRIVEEWGIDDPYLSSDGVRSISGPHADARRTGSDFAFGDPIYPTRLKSIAEVKHYGMEMSGTARPADIAGVSDAWDYQSSKLFVKLLQSIDNTAMYGQGSPETAGGTATSGATTAGDERRMQGLIHWCAWTGLERMHGSKTSIEDPYGVTIPQRNFSVCYNFATTPLTLDSFMANVIIPGLNNGSDLESNVWAFMGGYHMMRRVSRFGFVDGGLPLNDRNRSADDGMIADYLHTFKLPTGHTVTFRSNRWLNETGTTFSVNNTDYTPGSPTAEGSQNVTCQGDQTLIGYEPGAVALQWYREPAFRPVATSGDYSRVAAVAEFSMRVNHPLCVLGAVNALS